MPSLSVLPGLILTKHFHFLINGLQLPGSPQHFLICCLTAGTCATVFFKAWAETGKIDTASSVSMRDRLRDSQIPKCAGSSVPLTSDVVLTPNGVYPLVLKTLQLHLAHEVMPTPCLWLLYATLGEWWINGRVWNGFLFSWILGFLLLLVKHTAMEPVRAEPLAVDCWQHSL